MKINYKSSSGHSTIAKGILSDSVRLGKGKLFKTFGTGEGILFVTFGLAKVKFL